MEDSFHYEADADNDVTFEVDGSGKLTVTVMADVAIDSSFSRNEITLPEDVVAKLFTWLSTHQQHKQ